VGNFDSALAGGGGASPQRQNRTPYVRCQNEKKKKGLGVDDRDDTSAKRFHTKYK